MTQSMADVPGSGMEAKVATRTGSATSRTVMTSASRHQAKVMLLRVHAGSI